MTTPTPRTDALIRFEFGPTDQPFPAHALLAMIQLAKELERDLAAAQEALREQTINANSGRVERELWAEKCDELEAAQEARRAAEALAESYRKALLHERTALATVRDRQCHDGVCAISLADIEKGIALLDAAIAGEKP